MPTPSDERRAAVQSAFVEEEAPQTAADRFAAWKQGAIGRDVRRFVGAATGVMLEPDLGLAQGSAPAKPSVSDQAAQEHVDAYMRAQRATGSNRPIPISQHIPGVDAPVLRYASDSYPAPRTGNFPIRLLDEPPAPFSSEDMEALERDYRASTPARPAPYQGARGSGGGEIDALFPQAPQRSASDPFGIADMRRDMARAEWDFAGKYGQDPPSGTPGEHLARRAQYRSADAGPNPSNFQRELIAEETGAGARGVYGASRPTGPVPLEDDFVRWSREADARQQRGLNEASPRQALDTARHERDLERYPYQEIDEAVRQARTPPPEPVRQLPLGTPGQILSGAFALTPSMMAVEEIVKAQTPGGRFETLATLFDRPVRLDDLDKSGPALADLKADPTAREFLYADGLIDDDVYQAAGGGQ